MSFIRSYIRDFLPILIVYIMIFNPMLTVEEEVKLSYMVGLILYFCVSFIIRLLILLYDIIKKNIILRRDNYEN